LKTAMKKIVLLFLLLSPAGRGIHAQSTMPAAPVPLKRMNNAVSLDIHLPAGVFARSQFAGAGLSYSWSHRRYGRNISPSKLIGLTFNAGTGYYFGKKITTAGYDFNYGGYIYFHALAGMLVNPWPNGNIALTAGPGLGIYKGNTDLGMGVNLFGAYFLKKNIAIGPGLTYKKHPHTDALWTGAIRASYIF
jgi:hypothetical protein